MPSLVQTAKHKAGQGGTETRVLTVAGGRGEGGGGGGGVRDGRE